MQKNILKKHIKAISLSAIFLIGPKEEALHASADFVEDPDETALCSINEKRSIIFTISELTEGIDYKKIIHDFYPEEDQ